MEQDKVFNYTQANPFQTLPRPAWGLAIRQA